MCRPFKYQFHTNHDPFIQVRGNVNATAQNDILDNCVLHTLWLDFGKGPHMGVTGRCSQSFSHIEDVLPKVILTINYI